MTAPTTFQEFADALSDAAPRLSPQQRLIAQHVLEHPDDFALGTAATVAEAAGVQPSALVRFAYLGYLTVVGSTLGWLLHRDPDTYRYIPASIRRYPGSRGVADLMHAAGFTGVRVLPVCGGFMAIHVATK